MINDIKNPTKCTNCNTNPRLKPIKNPNNNINKIIKDTIYFSSSINVSNSSNSSFSFIYSFIVLMAVNTASFVESKCLFDAYISCILSSTNLAINSTCSWDSLPTIVYVRLLIVTDTLFRSATQHAPPNETYIHFPFIIRDYKICFILLDKLIILLFFNVLLYYYNFNMKRRFKETVYIFSFDKII